ncbi:MAG: hypothetical protein IJ753_09670 [Bacteroidales bacterium]|nr:hypothetical protein [Bacteroidales bacterium]MBR1783767.1 hypothetical protein [Bacteroidales bacterium]
MKKLIKLLFAFSLGLAMAGCAKYDDTELRGKVDSLTSEVNTLKANQQAMQAVIDVWKAGGYVASIDNSVPGQHTVTFYGDNGKTVVLYDGKQGEDGKPGADGDAFFKDVTSDENGVTFEKQDGTKIFIPFAKAFKLVIENPEAELEAGAKVEFAYKVENANSTTSVDVFAGGNYAAVVDAEASKIVVTAPTPAVNGSVLAWAQNEEGLFSMRKLSFFVKAETTVVTEEEEYQAISGDAGNFVIGLVSNVDVEIEKPTVDWITVVPDTKVAVTHKLTLALAENTTGEPREATINILRSDNKKQVQSIKIVQLVKSAEKVLTVERVWGKYPVALGKAWTSEYATEHAFIAGNDRTMAADDEYVYFAAASSSTKGILAISLKDPSVCKEVNITGVAGGLFSTACVRTIYNPSTSKYILLAGSLAFDGDYTFNVYAWKDGIDAAPTRIISWGTNERRVGDFFTVSGDWNKGEIWARTNIAGKNPVSFKWDITNGEVGTVMGGQMGYTGAAGMGSVYKYNVAAKQALVVTPSIGRFFNYKDNEGYLNVDSAGVDWTGIDNSVMARKFGITPFEFGGKKYIAYVKKGFYNNEGNAARARLKIIEDQGSAETFLASMEADKVVYEFPIQNKNNATTAEEFNEVYFVDSPSIAGQEMANCAVIPGTDCVYVVGHLFNVGVSVFKMYLK